MKKAIGFELGLDLVETLAFPLPDLDREKLQEMPVVVRRRRACSFRPVEQSIRYVEPYRAGSRCW